MNKITISKKINNFLMPWFFLPVLLYLTTSRERLYPGLPFIELYLLIIPIAVYLVYKYRWKGFITLVLGNSYLYFVLSMPFLGEIVEVRGFPWKASALLVIFFIAVVIISKNSFLKIVPFRKPYILIFCTFVILPLQEIQFGKYFYYELGPIIFFIYFLFGLSKIKDFSVFIILLISLIISVIIIFITGTPYFKLEPFGQLHFNISINPHLSITAILYFFVGRYWQTLTKLKDFKQDQLNLPLLIMSLPIFLMGMEIISYLLRYSFDIVSLPLHFHCAPYILPIGAFFAGLVFKRKGIYVFLFITLLRGLYIYSINIDPNIDPSYASKENEPSLEMFVLAGVMHVIAFGLLGLKTAQATISHEISDAIESRLIQKFRCKPISEKNIVIKDLKEWQRLHDETSKTIRKSMFTLLTYCFFCFITLSSPDISLIAVDARIKIPFAGIVVSYSEFLLIGSLVLIGICTYLYIFIGYSFTLNSRGDSSPLPFLFNISKGKYIAEVIFYLTPISTLCFFVWKAMPRPFAAFWLTLLTAAFCLVIIYIKIKRLKDDHAHKRKNFYTVAFCLIALFVGVQALNLKSLLSRPLNLYNAPLTDYDLRGADLKSADLKQATLDGANLSRALLNDSNMEGASLLKTDLSYANLMYANLNGAILEDANLTGAILKNADLTGVKLNGANLEGADLSNAKGIVCNQLKSATNWEKTYRDKSLSCGGNILIKKEGEGYKQVIGLEFKRHPLF